MATTLWQRDVIQQANDVKTTFSSWDQCMTKTYCKWPAIIGIIVASLIVLSVLTCVFRCLCCGVECCCGCFACFNACCPSPRKRSRDGYKEQPAYYTPRPPPQFDAQYQRPAAPVYGSNAPWPSATSAKTATFVTSHSSEDRGNAAVNRQHEDALPAMPSWSAATTRRIEEKEPEEVEMDKLEPSHKRQQSSISRRPVPAVAPAVVPASATYHDTEKKHDMDRWDDRPSDEYDQNHYVPPRGQASQWQNQQRNQPYDQTPYGASGPRRAPTQDSWHNDRTAQSPYREPQYQQDTRPYMYQSRGYESREHMIPSPGYQSPNSRNWNQTEAWPASPAHEQAPYRAEPFYNSYAQQPSPVQHTASGNIAMPVAPMMADHTDDRRAAQRPWRDV